MEIRTTRIRNGENATNYLIRSLRMNGIEVSDFIAEPSESDEKLTFYAKPKLIREDEQTGPSVEIRRNGRITDMILPHGNVRIIYGDHGIPTEPSLISICTNRGYRNFRLTQGSATLREAEGQLEFKAIDDYERGNIYPISPVVSNIVAFCKQFT